MNLDSNRASINEAIDAGLLAGAVTLVWQAGELLQVNELGYRDIEARLPMQRDTMFRIASMTKPITVAAAMTLVDEGRLALTDPVAKWLPELSEMRVMTAVHGSLEATVPAERPESCRTARTRTGGWRTWPSCHWRISPARG
jgi:CubicO group peptidase (beta-lactamase class C family)